MMTKIEFSLKKPCCCSKLNKDYCDRISSFVRGLECLEAGREFDSRGRTNTQDLESSKKRRYCLSPENGVVRMIVMICLFVCFFFFMLKLLQYCNYIIIVMQIKLMLLLLLLDEHAT